MYCTEYCPVCNQNNGCFDICMEKLEAYYLANTPCIIKLQFESREVAYISSSLPYHLSSSKKYQSQVLVGLAQQGENND